MTLKTASETAARRSTGGTPVPPKPEKLDANPYPWYSPRFWHGMRPMVWWRLCAAHGFRIHPIRWPMAFLIEKRVAASRDATVGEHMHLAWIRL